jgi:hypothetical protein
MRLRFSAGIRWLLLLGCLVPIVALALYVPVLAARNPGPVLAPRVFLPLLTGGVCPGVAGETYSTIVPSPPPSDRPAAQHADLNLALRGYAPTTNTLDLVDYGGATDANAPKLFRLFGDGGVPAFIGVSQVYNWDWGCNCRSSLITDPAVTLVNMSVTSGEELHVPGSAYNIGTRTLRPRFGFFLDRATDDPNAYEVLVLYAAPDRITLKYTREDNVIHGYTLHVENICTAPSLLALYEQANSDGRAQLPALKAGQVFAKARSTEIGIVIRDTGAFMDPRSRKDWW